MQRRDELCTDQFPNVSKKTQPQSYVDVRGKAADSNFSGRFSVRTRVGSVRRGFCMRSIATLVLALALATYGMPSIAGAAPQSGGVTGVAQASSGAPFSNHAARLRNVRTGDIAATTTTTQAGSFEFLKVLPGSYVVEVTDATGRVVATSGITSVSAGSIAIAPITAVTPTVGGSIGTPLLITLLAAGAASAVGVWSATKEEASPSR